MSDTSSTGPAGRSDWLGVAAGAAVAAAVLASTWHMTVIGAFGPGPGLFPRVVAFALLAISLVHAVLLLRRPVAGEAAPAVSEEAPAADVPRPEAGEEPAAQWGGYLRFAAMSASMFVYALVLERAGFLLATTFLAFMALWLLGRRPLRALVEAVVAVVVLRFAFGHLLGVPLPPSAIPLFAGLGF